MRRRRAGKSAGKGGLPTRVERDTEGRALSWALSRRGMIRGAFESRPTDRATPINFAGGRGFFRRKKSPARNKRVGRRALALLRHRPRLVRSLSRGHARARSPLNLRGPFFASFHSVNCDTVYSPRSDAILILRRG